MHIINTLTNLILLPWALTTQVFCSTSLGMLVHRGWGTTTWMQVTWHTIITISKHLQHAVYIKVTQGLLSFMLRMVKCTIFNYWHDKLS